MFKSTEIRWFNKERNETIVKWFAKHGLSLDSTNARTDYYLVAHDKDDIAPKLREGNIEIKHRIAVPGILQLSPGVEGYFEDWVKWSFRLDAEDGLAEKIINADKYHTEWMKVEKKRMGLKLAKGKNGAINIHDIKDFIDNGCQVEYTAVMVKGQMWYSFNLEWFGNEFLDLDSSFYFQLFGGSVLKLEDSMGYGKFLRIRK